MLRKNSCRKYVTIILVIGLIGLFSTTSEGAGDYDFFTLLYGKIADMMVPGGKTNDITRSGTARPSSVFLMELPGLSISREDLDQTFWKNNNFQGRSPDAVFADFVNRAPKYTDITFQDSGSRISDLWKIFMSSYLVNPNDNPVQLAAVTDARNRLFNSTLQADFINALQDYDAAVNAAFEARKTCLSSASDPSFCAITQVVPELATRSAWFNMETRRRDLLGAQATILALQTADLKTIFADALQDFERNLRIDVGTEGYGNQYYQTFASPSNWWTWFPPTYFNYDFVATQGKDGSVSTSFLFADCRTNGLACPVTPTAASTIIAQPQNGIVKIASGKVTYTANPGFVGGDYFGLDPFGNGTYSFSISVGVAAQSDRQKNGAFVSISAYSSETATSSYSSYATLASSSQARFSIGWFSVSGGYDASFTSSYSQFASSTNNAYVAFSVAKVTISRPWLNPLLLSFTPVGVRGVPARTWSDGTGLPSTTGQLRLPLIPTSFLVAKDIAIYSNSWNNFDQLASASGSVTTNLQVNYGPFYSGQARSSSSSSTTWSYQQSSFNSNTLTIPGPQVIGWVCSTLPAFPNTDPNDPVFNYKSASQ